MFISYSLKTGLNQHEIDTSAPSVQMSTHNNMPHRVSASASLDCWARMIPRQLEGGVQTADTTTCPVATPGRRSRSQSSRVLYPSSQPEPRQVRPTKRGVRFAPTERVVHTVLSKSSYSPSERHNTWYTRRGLLRIKTEAGAVVTAMRRGEYIDEYTSESVTSRGLERHAREVYNVERRERKCAVSKAVLEVQERQRRAAAGGTSRDEQSNIREASLNVSWKSMELARAAAEWDEYVVQADGHCQQTDVATEQMPMSRVVSDDDMEDEEDAPSHPSPSASPEPEPMEAAVPPPSPKGRHKRSVAEVYFQSYDVTGSEDAENTPPSYYEQTQQYGYEAVYPAECQQGYQHQAYSQHTYPQQYGCHDQYYPGDRYNSFTEVRAKRSIICR